VKATCCHSNFKVGSVESPPAITPQSKTFVIVFANHVGYALMVFSNKIVAEKGDLMPTALLRDL